MANTFKITSSKEYFTGTSEEAKNKEALERIQRRRELDNKEKALRALATNSETPTEVEESKVKNEDSVANEETPVVSDKSVYDYLDEYYRNLQDNKHTTRPEASSEVYTARGDRNNNPLNIKFDASIPWQGRRSNRTDDTYEEFETMTLGYRAAAKDIATKIAKGIDSYGDIISVWAPKTENNTDSYISHVTTALGVNASDKIDPNNREQMTNLMREMAKIELGHDVNMSEVLDGYDLARASNQKSNS